MKKHIDQEEFYKEVNNASKKHLEEAFETCQKLKRQAFITIIASPIKKEREHHNTVSFFINPAYLKFPEIMEHLFKGTEEAIQLLKNPTLKKITFGAEFPTYPFNQTLQKDKDSLSSGTKSEPPNH